MKKSKILLFSVFAALTALICASFVACAAATGSLKELTDPYIARYECTSATYGGKDILQEFDYIRITLSDKKNMELSFKKKNMKAVTQKCEYSYDEKSGEMSADVGIFGFRFKERTKIENGKFTLSLPIMGKQLVLNFSS